MLEIFAPTTNIASYKNILMIFTRCRQAASYLIIFIKRWKFYTKKKWVHDSLLKFKMKYKGFDLYTT